MSAFEDILAGDGNEDIREAFAAAEKDFSDLERLSAGDDSPGVAVHAVDETDTFGSVSPDGTPLVFAYREEDHGNAAYLVVAMGPDHIVYMPVSYVADIAAWMAARLAKATARGKDLG